LEMARTGLTFWLLDLQKMGIEQTGLKKRPSGTLRRKKLHADVARKGPGF